MLKIGLLEDEQDQAERLILFLTQYRQSHPQFSYTLQCYSRALELLDHYERDFDLLFLDIRLPDMTGMEAAHRIRESDLNVMIIYFELFDHDLLIHTDDGIIKQWGSLSKYEKQLTNAHFARCNSCYLVNLKFVRGIYGDEVEVGSDRLTVSKSRRKAFLQALAQYKGGAR